MADSKKKKSAPPKDYHLPNTRVPKELHEAAKRKSELTGISMAFIMRKAIEDWVREDGDGAKK